MFSPALGRVIRSAANIPLPSSAVSSHNRPVTVFASGLQQQCWTQAPHYHLRHRRLSSSKVSFPPDGSSPSPKNPLPKTPQDDGNAETSASETAVNKSTPKVSARKTSQRNTAAAQVAKKNLEPPSQRSEEHTSELQYSGESRMPSSA